MANTFVVSRAQLVYVLCLPLAVVLGYLLADPMQFGSMAIIAVVLGVLCVPVFIRWYHPLLILGWNAAIQPIFLPGQPALWMLLALAGIIFALLNRFVSPDARFIEVPSLTRPMLFLLAVVIFTSWMRGGIGMRILGSSNYGSRSYFWLVMAIAGFFAMTSQRIPKQRATLFACLYFLTGLTALIPNLASLGGGATEFVFYLFSPTFAGEQLTAGSVTSSGIVRLGGLSVACTAVLCGLLARYSIREFFDLGRPWRLALLLAAVTSAVLCGFRSIFILFMLILGVQCYFERLFNGRVLIGAAVAAPVLGFLLVVGADKLPMVAQRTLSFLPIPISPTVKLIGERSTDWRLDVWKDALPDIPAHLFVGKGYAVDSTELAFSFINADRHFMSSSEWVLTAGNFHSGPLSVIIPLGIWGVIGFVWFVIAALKYFYRNYKHGDPALHRINTLLLSVFIAKLILFLVVFGAFANEFYLFTGIVGLSVAINGPESPQPVPNAYTEAEEVAYTQRLVTE
jgi:hypothetical protein